jgi:hypothetical protein
MLGGPCKGISPCLFFETVGIGRAASAVAQLAPHGFLSPGRFSKNAEPIATANTTQKTPMPRLGMFNPLKNAESG